MNLEELLGCSADILEKMSDAELENYFAPYFNITRPELIKRPERKTAAETLLDPEAASAFKQNMKKMQALGIPIDEKQAWKDYVKLQQQKNSGK